MKVQPPAGKKEEDTELPDVKVDEVLRLLKLDPSQHFTKPTPRYSEASLVKELEKRGIGRPSTYASIISTIQDRGYVRVENRRFYAEKMGDIVTERLVESFSDLLDYGFTANMEESLDEVAEGQLDWTALLDRFYSDFTARLSAAEAAEGGMRPNEPTETDIPCPQCGRPMQIRTASTGVFLGCSGYSLPPKERCKATINLISGDEVVDLDADEEQESRLLINKHRCKLCNTAMDSYLIDEKRKLHVCGNNPDCPGFEVEQAVSRSRATTARSSSATSVARKCSSKRGDLASTLAVPTVAARIPANYCAVAKLRHRKWIRCRCPSCAVKKWMTILFCATVRPVFFLPPAIFPKTVKPERHW